MGLRRQDVYKTAAAWAAANTVLKRFEHGVETDTLFEKVGDGVTAWNDLDYFGFAASKRRQFIAFNPSANVSVPNANAYRDLDLAGAPTKYDPSGFIQSGAYNSAYTSQTHAAGTWIRLPVGVWVLEMSGVWAVNAVGDRIAEALPIDSRMNVAGINPVFGDPVGWQFLSDQVYIKASAMAEGKYEGTLAIWIITPEMIAASAGESPAGSGWAISTQLWQTSGGPLTLSAFSMVGARIA